MRRGWMIGLMALCSLPGLAAAGPVTLVWDSVGPAATGYEIEASTDGMATWTKVADVTTAVACTGTPVNCAVTVTAPATGLVFYRFTAKNAVGKTTRFGDGVWHCESCAPPTLVPNVGVK